MVKNMEKIRVVQVGTKHDHAADAVLTLKNLGETFTVLGVIEEDVCEQQKASENPDYSDVPFISWDEAFSLKPDAFIIESDEKTLTENALRVVEKGYHVYVDKPGSEDTKEFERLCMTAKEKGVVLTMGYMYRYNPAVIYAKELVKSGKLGDIISVEAQMNCSYNDKNKRKWLGNLTGGMMYFLGCHLIDLVVSIQGFPKEIIPLNTRTNVDGIDSVDFGFCVYKYDNGLSFVKTNATECNGFDRRQLVITGSKGTLEIKPLEITVGKGRLKKLTKARVTFGIDEKWVDNSQPVEFAPVNRYDAMFNEFAKYIKNEKENPFDYEYEAKLHSIVMRSCGE